jgi:hypothetical protein
MKVGIGSNRNLANSSDTVRLRRYWVVQHGRVARYDAT